MGSATFAAMVFFITATLSLSVILLQRSRSDETTKLWPEERRTIELFQRVAPSVVHVTPEGREHSPLPSPRADEDPGPGVGSGFVWNDRGYIVTNHHVVDHRGQVAVTLSDGSKYKADLVGFDEDADLAVIAIPMPLGMVMPLELGSSAGLQVGQKVFSIGTPFGLDQTLTVGVNVSSALAVVKGAGRAAEARWARAKAAAAKLIEERKKAASKAETPSE